MTANDTDYVIDNSWNINISMTNDQYWWIELYDNLDNLIDTVYFVSPDSDIVLSRFIDDNDTSSDDSWPIVLPTYSFELTNVYSENEYGENWIHSCEPFGTPRAENLIICPTASPTQIPSTNPTTFPTQIPSLYPSTLPTNTPSGAPIRSPTKVPTITFSPTESPTQEGNLEIDTNDTSYLTTSVFGQTHTSDTQTVITPDTTIAVASTAGDDVCYLWPTRIKISSFYLTKGVEDAWACWVSYYVLIIIIIVICLCILMLFKNVICAKRIAERKRAQMEADAKAKAEEEERLATYMHEQTIKDENLSNRLKSIEFVLAKAMTMGRNKLPLAGLNISNLKRAMSSGDNPRNKRNFGTGGSARRGRRRGSTQDNPSRDLESEEAEEEEKALLAKSMMNILERANETINNGKGRGRARGAKHTNAQSMRLDNNSTNSNVNKINYQNKKHRSADVTFDRDNYNQKTDHLTVVHLNTSSRNGEQLEQLEKLTEIVTVDGDKSDNVTAVPLRGNGTTDTHQKSMSPSELLYVNSDNYKSDYKHGNTVGSKSSSPTPIAIGTNAGGHTKSIMTEIMKNTGFGNKSNSARKDKANLSIQANTGGNESQSLLDDDGLNQVDDQLQEEDEIIDKQTSYGVNGAAGDKINWDKLNRHRPASPKVGPCNLN